jgi:hypothetical protein
MIATVRNIYGRLNRVALLSADYEL